MTPSFTFSPDNEGLFQKLLTQYPVQRSALIPALEIAQRQNGCSLSPEILDYIAERFSLPAMKVYEVASFYTMFKLKPVGKFHVQVCTTTPCWLRGSDKVLKTCEKWLGVHAGHRTEDGMFSLQEVECLGACIDAPMAQINDDYYENLDEKKMQSILEELSETGISSQAAHCPHLPRIPAVLMQENN